MSTSLAPDIERQQLSPLVEKWGQATKSGSTHECKQLVKEISAIISTDLKDRWDLVKEAIDWMRSDKRHTNAGVETLASETVAEQWYQYTRMELKRDDDQDARELVNESISIVSSWPMTTRLFLPMKRR